MTSGTRLGPYEIRTSLGRGGGGEVYLARDPRLERDVAIKILHAHLEGDPARVEAFVAEARAASALNHPNIVTVFDAGADSGRSYIVTELVDGKPLRDELNRGAVPLRRLLDLGTQIADGLAAAHEAGLRHGDLKPENIVVASAGRVKIVDFGLARPPLHPFGADGDPSEVGAPGTDGLTQTIHGLAAGTVPYMSPEQARGSAATPHSDQFALGLILYEMASGRRAFRGETPAATLDAILHAEPAPLPAHDGRVPVQLRWIIERCLAKQPGDRYASTSDLHRDLRLLRDRLAEALPLDQVAGTPPRRRWRALGLASAVLLSLAAGAVAALWLQTAPPDFSPLRFLPLTSDQGYQGQPAWSPKAQAIAFVKAVNGRLQIFTRKVPSGETTQITNAGNDCTHPFWSEDGQRLYYVSLAKEIPGIWTISADGGSRAQVVVMNASRGALSRDGLTIAFLRDAARTDVIGTASLWIATPPGPPPWKWEDVDRVAERRWTFGGKSFIEGALAFSPDKTKLGVMVVPDLSEKLGWQFWVVPLQGGKESRRLEHWTKAAPRISSFTWLSDSLIVLGASSLETSGSQLWLADLDADEIWQMTSGSESQSYPSASPDGRQVVYVAGEPDYDLAEIDLDQRTMRPWLSTTRNESDPAFARDGRLAFVTDRQGKDEIWISSGADGDIGVPHIDQSDFGDDDTLMLGAPVFSRSGALAFLRNGYDRNGYDPRGVLRIWVDLNREAQPTPLLRRMTDRLHGNPTWAPARDAIAFPEWRDGAWRLMRVDVGTEQPEQLLADGTANASPEWSPDGKWLTWEDSQGFLVVSPETFEQIRFSYDEWATRTWLAHAWTSDSRRILGIQSTHDGRLVLVEARLDTRTVRQLMSLGTMPPVNNPVKGFDISPDGRRAVTSIARLRGNLWLVEDLDLVRRARWPVISSGRKP